MKISKNDAAIYQAVRNQPGNRLSAAQWRMARAALKLNMRDMAKVADTSTTTIVNIEKSKPVHFMRTNKIRAYFESRGVEFLDCGGVHYSNKARLI